MDSKMKVENLDLYYGKFKALKNINLDLPKNEITAFIGPSGCGKSTLLKSLNRMNDLVEGCKITGKVTLDGEDIYGDMDAVSYTHLRAHETDSYLVCRLLLEKKKNPTNTPPLS